MPKSQLALPSTRKAFLRRMVENLYHAHGQPLPSASDYDIYMALAYTVRDFLIDRWRSTIDARQAANPKYVYYLSAEYLLGKQLPQNLLYTGTEKLARRTLAKTRADLEGLIAQDAEPGLGNGGPDRSMRQYCGEIWNVKPLTVA